MWLVPPFQNDLPVTNLARESALLTHNGLTAETLGEEDGMLSHVYLPPCESRKLMFSVIKMFGLSNGLGVIAKSPSSSRRRGWEASGQGF